MMRACLVVLMLSLIVAMVAFTITNSGDDPYAKPDPSSAEQALYGLPRSRFLIEHDRFIAATDPRVIAAGDARWLAADSEVFGVVLDGHARAYPVPMIAYYHVVNDRLAGIPVAVTY